MNLRLYTSVIEHRLSGTGQRQSKPAVGTAGPVRTHAYHQYRGKISGSRRSVLVPIGKLCRTSPAAAGFVLSEDRTSARPAHPDSRVGRGHRALRHDCSGRFSQDRGLNRGAHAPDRPASASPSADSRFGGTRTPTAPRCRAAPVTRQRWTRVSHGGRKTHRRQR